MRLSREFLVLLMVSVGIVEGDSLDGSPPGVTRDPSIEDRRRLLRKKQFRRKWRQKLIEETERLANISTTLEPSAELVHQINSPANQTSDILQLPGDNEEANR